MDETLAAFSDTVGGADAGPVAVEGARTRWDVGRVEPRRAGPVDEPRLVRAPDGIVDYTPQEMTVTVRAGTPVADLNKVLAEAGQRCSLPERGGTVGGAIAVGEDRVDAPGRGRVRSDVLRVRYVSADGRLISGGGPTVKNVTGFDLPRLMVGSLGTLGCIAEITLRTNPEPAVSRWYHAPDADAYGVRDTLYRPAALLRRAPEGSNNSGGRGAVWVLLEGHAVDVDDQVRLLADHGDFTEATGPTLPPHRWSMTPTATRNLPAAIGDGVVISVLTGTVFASNPAPDRALSPEVAAVSRRLKELFDPTGRLNPGRTPGRP